MIQDAKEPRGETGGGGDGPIFDIPPDEKEKAAAERKITELKKAGLPLPEPGGKDDGPIFENDSER